MNKSIAKLLVYSAVTLTGTIGLGLGISRSVLGQDIVAQEVESSFSDSVISGRLDPKSETLESGEYFNTYTFEGKAGEQLTIDLVSEKFDAYLILFDSKGNHIAEDDDSGSKQNAKIVVTLPQTETYEISVTSKQTGELGEYVLSLGEATAKDLALVEVKKLNQQVIELYQRGKYSEAIPLLEQALTIRREQLGDNHPSTAAFLSNLAKLYRIQGRYAKAEPLYQQALAITREQLGDNHPSTAAALNNLAGLYQAQGRYAKAEPLYQQALAIVREQLGDNHLSTATSLNNLALLYQAQGRYTAAEPLHQQALAIVREQLGDNHPRTAAALNNLAGLYRAQGRYAKAEPLYQKSLGIKRAQLGDNHPDTAAALNNLAELYRTQGRYAKAEPLYQQALAITREQLGDNHPNTATSLNNLALLYQAQGRYLETEPLLQQALTIRRAQLGDNHPDTAAALNNLAELYRTQGSYAEAEPLFQQALSITREQLGDNHPHTAATLNNLALLYQAQGRYPEAEPLLQQALTIRRAQLGDNHPDTAAALNNLAELYRTQGSYAEAEPLLQQALTIRRAQLGDNYPHTAATLNNLAELYRTQGSYAEAEPLYQEVLAIVREQLGDNHPDTATSLNNMALLYQAQERYPEAEPLLQQALTIRRAQLGDNHPDTAAALNNLAALYESQENIDRAIELLIQGLKVEEDNLSENLIAGSEQQKRDYIATISSTTHYAISLNLQSARNNPDTTNLALTSILQRKGRILDVLTNSLQILRQRTDDPTTQALLTDYYNLRNQYSNLVFRKPEEIESPDIHRQQLIELETQTKQLEDQLSRRSAEFRNLSEPITLGTIQKLIPKNSALVELVLYYPYNPQASIDKRWGQPRYAAYILRSDGQPQAIDLGEAKSIDKAVDQFRQNLCTKNKTAADTQFCLDNRPLEQVKSSARQLEQMVMQPVRQLLGDTKNILLSPDSKLNLVPFEALFDENNQYLVENYNFTYLASGRDLMRLQHKSPSEELPLVIADPLYGQEDNLIASNLPQRSVEDISKLFSSKSFPRLAATEKEAKEIQSLLNLLPERIKLQNQASETLLKQVKSPQILHIATHGFFLDKPSTTKSEPETSIQINDNPLFRSGLVLAGVESNPSEVKSENDGVFTAYEATFLDLVGTKLVVLSACDTGVGDITTGEGIYGLRRALVIAGSESQLISLWKVVDEGTKDLMEAYYQRLQQGKGRTTALHEVQKQMLRGELTGENGQSYQHPYYWASFIPSGDWTPMEFSISR